jgi:hypothetical protein
MRPNRLVLNVLREVDAGSIDPLDNDLIEEAERLGHVSVRYGWGDEESY